MYDKIDIKQLQEPITKLRYEAESQQGFQEMNFLKKSDGFLLNIRNNLDPTKRVKGERTV